MFSRDIIFGFCGAVVFHVLALLALRFSMFTEAEYGIDVGLNSVEVSLVSSVSSEPSSTPLIEPIEQTPKIPLKAEEQEMRDPEPQPVAESLPPKVEAKLKPEPQVTTQIQPAKKIDSKQPNSMALHSDNGAITQIKPAYLKNPPPGYPEVSRRRGEEGVVVLVALVGADGEIKELKVKESSGFEKLDQAAVMAVKKWRFQPAKMGMIDISSEVEIPIRFRLKT
jgi:periplasmic protein TonB